VSLYDGQIGLFVAKIAGVYSKEAGQLWPWVDLANCSD